MNRTDTVFLNACRGEATERVPIWIMRQAGRYLPEYRRIRKKVSFLELCHDPELACEVSLQPVRALGVDAAILFSDILVPIEPLGRDLSFPDGPPVIGKPIREARDLDALPAPRVGGEVGFVAEAVRKIRRALPPETSLIGFAGAPFTVAAYLVEGGGSKSFSKIKALCAASPKVAEKLLSYLSDLTAHYLSMQIDAGVDAVQLFDTWAGQLAPDDFETFALRFSDDVFERLGGRVPRILYTGNGAPYLGRIGRSRADVIGLDWRVRLDEARDLLGAARPVQGNLDPTVLLADQDTVRRRTREILHQNAGRAGYIFNLGHGILPTTPVACARAVVETVHEYRRSAGTAVHPEAGPDLHARPVSQPSGGR